MRSNLKPKEHIKLANQSLVYEAFADNEKLTISELTWRINETRERHERISDQTIRRAIADLVRSGHIKPYGKQNNAQTYGRLSASISADAEKEKVIPFGGDLVSIEDFVRLLCEPDSSPLSLKVPLLGEEAQHSIRRTMVHVILTSGEVGTDDALKKSNRRLHNVIAELEYVLNTLQTFVNSPIWYPQYRERIAFALRRMQEKDAELFQLAEDYVRSQ